MKSVQGAIITVAVAVAALVCCSAATAAKRIYSPSKVRNDYDARIASTGDSLWLAVIGASRQGEYIIKVYRFKSGRWAALPGHPGTLYGGGLKFAVLTPAGGEPTPCVGDSPRDLARIRCFSGGTWRELPIADELRGFALAGLRSDGPRLTAVLGRWNEDKTTTVRVARTGGLSLEAEGPPLELAGLVQSDLGEVTTGTDASKIDVGLQVLSSPAYGQRTLATLEGATWSVGSRITTLHGGPQLTGPVRSGASVFIPVVNGLPFGRHVSRWPFYLLRNGTDPWTPVGGKRISTGNGANTGGVHAVGSRIWVVWETLRMTKKMRFKGGALAARVSPDGRRFDRRITLRKGPGMGNQILQAISFRNRPAFLYAKLVRGRFRATVDLSRR